MDMNFSGKVLILDGSFGLQLSKHIPVSLDKDPLWTSKALATNPEAVIKAHEDFVKAGCDIIETNTYQASVPGFVKYLNITKEQSFEVIKSAVELARTAIDNCVKAGYIREDKKPLIAGSIGPYGAYLHDGSEYTGNYTDFITDEQLKDYHKKRIEALLEAGCDLLAIETIPSKKEALFLVEFIKKYQGVRAWLSFSCKVDELSTAHGDEFPRALIDCYERNPEQLVAVGVNCIAPHAVEKLLADVNTNRPNPIPLIVYANSGETYNPNTGWDNNCEKLEEYIPRWLDLGVKIVGGCCRIGDNYISKIKEQVLKWEDKQEH